MSDLTISIIGAGNLAFHLAHAFVKNSITVQEICNRSEERTRDIIELCGARYVDSPGKLERVDIMIIAISDQAIEEVSRRIPKYHSTIIAHTSGSISMTALSPHSNYGAFYPLQSFRRGREIDFRKIPVFISSDDAGTKNTLYNLARRISDNPIIIEDQQRSILHLPAVMVNNFTNHLFAQARDICERNELDFSILIPLIEETISRLYSGAHPARYQTGPAIRNDQKTIENHKKELSNNPSQLKLYNFLTASIQQYHK